MKTNRGFTLIEVLVALGIFAIVAASITALMTSGLRTRQTSQRTLNAQQAAYAIIEDHKNLWSVKSNYTVNPSKADQRLIPYWDNKPNWSSASYLQNVGVEVRNVSIAYGCLDSNGTNRTNTVIPNPVTSQAQILNCTTNDPALRRVTVTVRDAQNRVTANLTSEIGKPNR
jgi:prepilin-type N-terminal cleavage/methylation domain-containing protein